MQIIFKYKKKEEMKFLLSALALTTVSAMSITTHNGNWCMHFEHIPERFVADTEHYVVTKYPGTHVLDNSRSCPDNGYTIAHPSFDGHH